MTTENASATFMKKTLTKIIKIKNLNQHGNKKIRKINILIAKKS